jgi:hypothetical protein
MKINTRLVLLLTLSSKVVFGQLINKEIIAYKTTIRELEETKFQSNNYMKSLLDSLGIKDASKQIDLDEIAKALKKESESFELISTLQNVNDLIYVRMIRKVKDAANTSQTGVIGDMSKGIQFRGYLSKEGSIYSYYLKNQQKNILAIFFQLPEQKVKVGDSWTIDSQWFSNDQTFKCDKAERVNEVKLKDLKIVKKDTIALISYNIKEFLEGTTQIPWSKENKKATYKMSYTGDCEFNVSQGRWENFGAIMDTEAFGFQNIKQKLLYSLTPYKLDQGDTEILEKD